MRLLTCTLIVVFTLLLTDVLSEQRRKHKKIKNAPEELNDADDVALNEIDVEEKLPDEATGDEDLDMIDNRVPFQDPCSSVHCGAGRVCELDNEDEPQCVCISECQDEIDPRRKVCSNLNETWPSDCAIYQQRCWCDVGDSRCLNDKFKHMHIEYYGECRKMPKCTKDERADFPRRMRDWLFNIMRDLADRRELPNIFIKMEREAETNLTRRWINAAIWKWCDLDGHPHDRAVSRHELFPIRAPLLALEHCIGPFLDDCDFDNNHRITFKEWAKCLELEEDDIEAKCEDLEAIYNDEAEE